MPHRPFKTITAQFECAQIELPDADLSRDTYVLAPSYFFGSLFYVTAVEEVAAVDRDRPRRKVATATVSYALYGLMLQVQQGADAMGKAPLWALVDRTAMYDDTGELLETGEVPPLFP